MKRKIFYAFVLTCCLSIISIAGPYHQTCSKGNCAAMINLKKDNVSVNKVMADEMDITPGLITIPVTL
ncbi:MAG: hypothetical protein ABJA78_01005 [Ferruginibacter sp.]